MNRIVELGKQIWSLLTEDERERYNIAGTFTFVENLVSLLNLNDFDWDDINMVESIHDKIFD